MGITRLGHIAFEVEDVERSAAFAETITGLRSVSATDGVAFLTSNDRHHQLQLDRGQSHRCLEVGFDVTGPEEIDRIAERAAAAGLGVGEPSATEGIERKIQVEIPDGPTLALCTGVATSTPQIYSTLGTRPRKLGHVTIASPDVERVGTVLTEVLGFRLSDQLPLGDHADGELRWYRCNSDHHALGLTPGPSGVHHYAFEVDGFAAFGAMGDHLLVNGIRYIWGPGRHGPGANLFSYYEDADGSMIEFYADMLQIVDDDAYELGEWPDVESSANVWGPPPPQRWFEYSTPFAGLAAPAGSSPAERAPS